MRLCPRSVIRRTYAIHSPLLQKVVHFSKRLGLTRVVHCKRSSAVLLHDRKHGHVALAICYVDHILERNSPEFVGDRVVYIQVSESHTLVYFEYGPCLTSIVDLVTNCLNLAL